MVDDEPIEIPRDVPDVVNDYSDECRARGILDVRIVHGKGIGVLRTRVHSVLSKRDDVESFQLGSVAASGGGATLVRLRPQAPPQDA